MQKILSRILIPALWMFQMVGCVNVAYLISAAKKAVYSDKPEFVVYENKLTDTVTGDVTFHNGYNRLKFDGKQIDVKEVNAFQLKDGFYIRFDGTILRSYRQSYPQFFVRIVNGKKLDLFAAQVNRPRVGRNSESLPDESFTALMIVAKKNYVDRRVMTPDILSEFVADDKECLELVDKYFKRHKNELTNDYRSVQKILDVYNAKS